MQTGTPHSPAQQMEMNQALSRKCADLAHTVADATIWIHDNPDVIRSKGVNAASLERELRKAALTFTKCATAAQRKMCVGVFGPSQAGKSYLISALACPTDGALMADFSGERIDFIRDINPTGSKESTGLVTRFTTTRPENAPADAPVHLRMLTESDIICILTNTYYEDCEHPADPAADDDAAEAAAIAAVNDVLRGLADAGGAGASGLPQAQAEEVREYVTRYFSAEPQVAVLRKTGFWNRALELAPRLSASERGRLFGCLWQGDPAFVNLYVHLAEALRAIGNPDCAWCPLSVLKPRETSIIDVAQLARLQEDCAGGAEGITVISESGQRAALPRSVITALTAELTIYMPEKPDTFFDYTDLLDFPGYRSRLKVPTTLTHKELDTFFLRGKVAYLFQRYCEERELTSMLLCIGHGPQETSAVLRPAVKSWIDAVHGNTAQSRAGMAPALFFILTKIDTIFERKAGDTTLRDRWKSRLGASLLEPFNKGNDPWPGNWDGKPFNNVFLLRNPKVRCDIFDFDAAGHEVGVLDSNTDFVQAVKADFDACEEVQAHVYHPQEAFAAMMSLNDGGVGFLRDKLRPLCNPDLKRRQIATVVEQTQAHLHSLLFPCWDNDDREEARREKLRRAKSLAGHLANLATRDLFGDFLRSLQISDHELFALYKRVEQERLQQPDAVPNIEVTAETVSQDAIMNAVFGAADPEPEPAPDDTPEGSQPMNSVTRFAAVTLDAWTDQLRDLATSEAAQNYFAFPGTELCFFVDEIILAFKRLGLPEKITAELSSAASYGNMQQEHILWRQASISSSCVNGFVNWLGLAPATHDATERTVNVMEQTCTLFQPPPVVKPFNVSEQPRNYSTAYCIDWLRALAHAIEENVDFAGGVTIDREQNKRLGAILHAFKVSRVNA